MMNSVENGEFKKWWQDWVLAIEQGRTLLASSPDDERTEPAQRADQETDSAMPLHSSR